ncbi:hypothetical protein ACJX0J_011053 [Zea mays]
MAEVRIHCCCCIADQASALVNPILEQAGIKGGEQIHEWLSILCCELLGIKPQKVNLLIQGTILLENKHNQNMDGDWGLGSPPSSLVSAVDSHPLLDLQGHHIYNLHEITTRALAAI